MLRCTMIALAMIMLMFLVSCEKCEREKGCEAYDEALKAGATAISSGLECKETKIIYLDLKRELDKLIDVCEPKVRGLEDSACGMIADYAVKKAKESIPKKWECKADKAGAQLHLGIVLACKEFIGDL